MSRILKRVPLDFNYKGIWKGYLPEIKELKNKKAIVKLVPEINNFNDSSSICYECEKFFKDCNEDARYCLAHNKELKTIWYYEPPTGEGFQLWETVSEGSPISPVFESLEELCIWSEENATIYGDIKISKDEWFDFLNNNKQYQLILTY